MCVSHICRPRRSRRRQGPPSRLPPSRLPRPLGRRGVLLLLRLFDFLPNLSRAPESRETSDFFVPTREALFDPGRRRHDGSSVSRHRLDVDASPRVPRLGGDDTRERSRVPRRFRSVFVREGTHAVHHRGRAASNGDGDGARTRPPLFRRRAPRPSPAIPRQPPAPTRAASPRRKEPPFVLRAPRGARRRTRRRRRRVRRRRRFAWRRRRRRATRARPRPHPLPRRWPSGGVARRLWRPRPRASPPPPRAWRSPRPPAPRPRPEAPPPPAGPPRRSG